MAMVKKWEELSQLEIDSLVKEGVLNGAGAKKGRNYDYIIEKLKGKPFAEDAKVRVWYPHDYRYTYGKRLYEKIVADIKMFFNLYSLLEDYNVVFKERILISVGAFMAVILFGNEAFYDGKNNNSTNK